MAKQIEFLCAPAGCERLQHAERRLSAGLYRQTSEEHSPNGLAADSSDGQGTSREWPMLLAQLLGARQRETKVCLLLNLNILERLFYTFCVKINW